MFKIRINLQKQGSVEVQPQGDLARLMQFAHWAQANRIPDNIREVDYLAKGIGEEAGEILGVLKKMDRGDANATLDWLIEEMGDLLYYLLRLCSAKHIDPSIVGGCMIRKTAGLMDTQVEAAMQEVAAEEYIDIVLGGTGPGSEFIDIHTRGGLSARLGERVTDKDGHTCIRITAEDINELYRSGA